MTARDRVAWWLASCVIGAFTNRYYDHMQTNIRLNYPVSEIVVLPQRYL